MNSNAYRSAALARRIPGSPALAALVLASLFSLHAVAGQDGARPGPQGAASAHSESEHEHGAQGQGGHGQDEHGADDHGHGEQGHGGHEEGRIRLTPRQAADSGITISVAGPGWLEETRSFPGEIRLNADRIAHVTPRLPGIVERVQADLGQQVETGQVLATLSSPALADMRSELLAATKRRALAAVVYQRERRLWREKISAEQDYLEARGALAEADIAVENIRQKLGALGVSQDSSAQLGRLDLTAPFGGMVVEKHLSLGESAREEASVFTIADLGTVWVDFQVAASDLRHVRVGGQARISSPALPQALRGTVSYVGALVGQQTRAATARVVMENPDLMLRPGIFVTVETADPGAEAAVTVASEAVQVHEGKPVVFVEAPDGFEVRPVTPGRKTLALTEIVQGLAAGERYAAQNSFTLKSELGKASAEHSH